MLTLAIREPQGVHHRTVIADRNRCTGAVAGHSLGPKAHRNLTVPDSHQMMVDQGTVATSDLHCLGAKPLAELARTGCIPPAERQDTRECCEVVEGIALASPALGIGHSSVSVSVADTMDCAVRKEYEKWLNRMEHLVGRSKKADVVAGQGNAAVGRSFRTK